MNSLDCTAAFGTVNYRPVESDAPLERPVEARALHRVPVT
jgi:hypothetical protein